jgi:hypothetical protein
VGVGDHGHQPVREAKYVLTSELRPLAAASSLTMLT